MPTQPASDSAARPVQSVEKIVVRIKVGEHRMAATDDPVFLQLVGPSGREFRLTLARGRSLRRGAEDVFVIGSPNAPDTNLAHPELNDPTHPALELAGIERVLLWKGMEPLPNVRGMGEMDDRLEVAEVEVEVYSAASAKPTRFYRRGPLWLGLLSGRNCELSRVHESA